MNKPTFIPQDIWDSAIRSAGGEDFAYPSVVEAIAHSVWEERQRCAALAARFRGYADSDAGSAHSREAKLLAEDTASWIEQEICTPSAPA